jgi:Bacterial Ig-like domain (group 3)
MAATITGAVLASTVGSAGAVGTPPWETSNANQIGTLTFYDASGNPITGGSDLSHIAAYVLASSPDTSTKPGTLAELEFANPQNGVPASTWNVKQDEQTSFPNSSAPTALAASANPLVSLDSTGGDLVDAIGGFDTSSPVTGFPNVYQLRVFTSGVGGAGTHAGNYWDADVQVDTTAGTWVEVYPTSGAQPIATTTAVTVSPATSASQGATVTVTGTETAADATHPAGMIALSDGNQPLGTGAVDANGAFSVPISTLQPGTHSLTAVFTDSASGYTGSTSPAVSYLINPVAKTPTISGTAKVGDKLTCKETTTSGETATFTWDAAGKKVGTGSTLTVPASTVGKTITCTVSVKVTGGTASTKTSAATKKVAEGSALKATKKPTLSGAGKVGKTEKVAHGTWSPAASSYSYQWYLGSRKIAHATKSSYKLVKADGGKKVSVKVTAKKTGYASGTATTKSLKVKK